MGSINNKNNSIRSSTSKYLEYFKIGFRKSVEYKSYLIGALTTPVFMGVFFYFIWNYIYEVKWTKDVQAGVFTKSFAEYTIPAGSAGFTFNEMIVYLVIGLLIQTVKSTELANKISETIKSGDIAIFLCRPVNFVKSLFADGIGEKVIPFSTFAILLVVMTQFFDIGFPAPAIFILFVIYGFLLVFFQIIIEIMIGGLAFWLTEIWGVKSSIQQILWILSGRALPLNLFPKVMQAFLAWTPFLYLEYTFARVYLGKMAISEVLVAMGIFTVWIFIMLGLMMLLYRKGFGKLESFGG